MTEPTTDPTPEALIEAVARSLCEALIGDDVEWRQHRTNAGLLIEALRKHGALDSFAQAAVERERERLGNCPKCGSEGYGYEDDDNVESCIDCGHRGKL